MLHINLLSPEKRRANTMTFYARRVHAFVAIAFFLLVAFTALALGVKSFLVQMLLETSSSARTSPDVRALELSVRTVNEDLAILDRQMRDGRPWAPIITDIMNMLPEGVRLDKFYSEVSNTITLHMEGSAETREAVLTFRDAVDALPYVEHITFPASNILTRTNVAWQLTVTLDENKIPTYASLK